MTHRLGLATLEASIGQDAATIVRRLVDPDLK